MSEAIARQYGITYRQLDHWVRAGYLRPFNPRDGIGHPRRWPDGELAIARDMGVLVKAGLTVAAAHRVARSGRTGAVLALVAEGSDAA